MVTTHAHPPGTFCWVDLAAKDPVRAKLFYGELFGWDYRDEAGDWGVYTTASRRGAPAAGLYTAGEAEHARGDTPRWTPYVTVISADRVAEAAVELGGAIVEGPVEVSGAGRMAEVEDRVGARFRVWQPLTHQGMGRLGEPGFVAWTELLTTAPDAAIPFYEGLFGWTASRREEAPRRPWIFTLDEQPVAGMVEPPPEGVEGPSHWLVYVTVRSCDATVEEMARLGGRTLVAPRSAGEAGRLALLRDPQGAHFGLFEYAAALRR